VFFENTTFKIIASNYAHSYGPTTSNYIHAYHPKKNSIAFIERPCPLVVNA
jgi:hypothetical protein